MTRRTLHEASMLWIVIQMAMTLKVGDQSSPRMEAHIWATR